VTDKPEMHPVRKTIVRNAVNIAQPGDLLPASAVENLKIKVGEDDDAEVGPLGADPVVPEPSQLEFRYDRPVVPEQVIATANAAPVVATEPESPEPESTPTRRKAKSGDA
jgi:hypothetical protein